MIQEYEKRANYEITSTIDTSTIVQNLVFL